MSAVKIRRHRARTDIYRAADTAVSEVTEMLGPGFFRETGAADFQEIPYYDVVFQAGIFS